MNRRNLAEWASIAEIIGAVTVVISLLFVAWNIQQNTDAIKASTWESFLDRSERVNLLIAESDDLAGIMQRGQDDPGQLTEEEYFRFQHLARMRFGAWEAIFSHHRIGRLDAANWEVWNAFYLDLMNHAGYRRVWSEIEQWYDPEFREIMRTRYLRE